MLEVEWDCVESMDNLRIADTLTLWSQVYDLTPVYEHGMYGHLFNWSLVSQQCFAVFNIEVFYFFCYIISRYLTSVNVTF